MENVRGRGAHFVDGYRLQRLRQPFVVVETKIEPLAVLEKCRNTVVRFEQPWDGSNQVRAALVHLERGGTVESQIADFSINCLDRSIDVFRIDTGAHDQRALPKIGAERAECVVRHSLPLADVIGQPSSQTKLPEDVVQYPVRV